MKFSKKAVEEFRDIWKKKFGEDIAYDEAQKKGIELLQLFKLTYKPIPKNQSQSEED